MAKLYLEADPAQRSSYGGIQVTFGIGQSVEVLPRREIEARNVDEIAAALDTFAAEVAATGKGAQVSARLLRGERAPRGFRKMETRRYVNLD